MQDNLQKIVVVCGPTAVGKTDFALSLAKELPADLISADSRQVYRGMDIGTGKDIPSNASFHSEITVGDSWSTYSVGWYAMNHTKLWLYDLTSPDKPVSVSTYRLACLKVLIHLRQQQRLPIIVGGTGFYIRNVINPAATLMIPPNLELRQMLDTLSVSQLQEKLKELDENKFVNMNSSDRVNSRRLIRAIEVANAPQKTYDHQPNPLNVCWIGLTAPKEILIDRIRARVLQRVDRGFTQEVKKLMVQFPQFESQPIGQTIGYYQWTQYLKGNIEYQAAIEQWIQAEVSYMKRQLTWFKKEPTISWFDITSKTWYAQAKAHVINWMNYGN